MVTLTITIIQLAYPTGRALPFTRIGNYFVGLTGGNGTRAALSALQDQQLTIHASQHSYQVSYAEIGLEIDIDASARELADYPLSQRLVPFSIFAGGRANQQKQIAFKVNEGKLMAFIQKVITENSKAPVEGSVGVEGMAVNVHQPVAGLTYDTEVLSTTLRQSASEFSKVIELPGQKVEAVYTQKELELAATKARAIINQPLSVHTLGQSKNFDPATIASWLVFVPNPETKAIEIGFSKERIKDSLREHAASVHLAPGWTTVTTLDRTETSRTPGSPGHMLAMDATVDAITIALKSSSGSVEGTTAVIPASPRYDRNYSATSIGLQYLLDDWVASNPGATWGIVVEELGGQQRYAAIRQNDKFITASVYKLFLAYSVLTKVDEGSMDANAITSTGATVNSCIESMIVHSDNACSHALGNMAGWDSVTAMQHARGFTSTTLNDANGFYTTANDTTEILELLYAGQLMTPGPNGRLLDMMKRQVYRNGIPTGSTPSVVANKVGYVDGWRHDVGIVYHPKGAYIISVLSYGGSYPQVVNLSRSIYNYMSQ